MTFPKQNLQRLGGVEQTAAFVCCGAGACSAAGILLIDLFPKGLSIFAMEAKDKVTGRFCSVLLFSEMH